MRDRRQLSTRILASVVAIFLITRFVWSRSSRSFSALSSRAD